MGKAGHFFALALFVAAAAGFVSQTKASTLAPAAAVQDAIAGAASPPIAPVACVTLLGQRICIDDDDDDGEKKKQNQSGEKKEKNKKKSASGNQQSNPTSCGQGEVLLKQSTPDGKFVTKCLPGAKQVACGENEVLYRSSNAKGELVTKCLPGAKNTCGENEVLYKSAGPDGKLVTKCLPGAAAAQ